MTIDPEKVLPSWRFILSPEMAKDAEAFARFIKDVWVPFGWTDEQLKSWVEKTVIGKMPERWPMIYKIDQKLEGMISATLQLMCHKPKDLPPGYIYTFGETFFGITGPDDVRKKFRSIIEYKRSGGAKDRKLEPGEEEYSDALIIAISSKTGDVVHRDDLGEEAQVKLDKKEAALKKKQSVNLSPVSA
ncbi:hypothetical protein [Neorhizobium galegae]|uniref:Uncharacterized protein n=1 Tax=Neorhizobium galegae bv. orientalis str. HAMBI 540 TaxID=1028800 RepID=A0A068SKZ0_NEOGA|nr:hypothetical protein [Neorhizobium galegae]MCQ1855888.1 hypothetical protein [Neorhizobium galegae]CDN46862.1 Hypothetical protein RG540_CH06720 [Neorhizobium galegae bv. orientalis str. HAMBI 540]